jgi:hypothetical protein
MPPIINTKVIPAATISKVDVCLITFTILLSVKKLDDATDKIMNKATIASMILSWGNLFNLSQAE